MTPEEFFNKMKDLDNNLDLDPEDMHIEADNLMCDLLTELGYGDGVEVFAGMMKWYA